MQYHQNGFRPGDPSVQIPVRNAGEKQSLVDVLIIGCGPAGLTLAAQLAAFPEITTRIVEQKSGPLEFGQADGIACRSMEMFEAFGFAHQVKREAYWVNETSFWRPDLEGKGIARADRILDVEDGLSEFPHTILSQVRVHDFFLAKMRNSPSRLEPDYNRRLSKLEVTTEPDYPIAATFECLEEGLDGQTENIRARYVVGCDGARSVVRESLGYALAGQSARQLWGVMDILAISNFPDIRLKCAIQSATEGSMLLIPREGGFLVRMYIELDELDEGERVTDREINPDMLIDKAKAILHPYTLDVKDVGWWSAYEIGQRVCDYFDDVPDHQRTTTTPRIFIAGDACHTHSPKAGQGMNVSMADTFNLGWKLASVILGRAKKELLNTYTLERQAKAKELIDFDREMASLFSTGNENGKDGVEFQRYFSKFARYTAGVETLYNGSIIVGPTTHQALAEGFQIGMRFHSAPVIRMADAKPMHLGHRLKADGRWRLIAFGDENDIGQSGGAIAELCKFLDESINSPLRKYTPQDLDDDALFDVLAVFQQNHRDLLLAQMPALLLPAKGRYGLTDFEKIYCPDLKPDNNIFDMRGIDREHGALVVVRPDQFVAHVLPLQATDELAGLAEKFMLSGQT